MSRPLTTAGRCVLEFLASATDGRQPAYVVDHRCVARLEADGYVELELERTPRPGRRDKIREFIVITDAGRQALEP